MPFSGCQDIPLSQGNDAAVAAVTCGHAPGSVDPVLVAFVKADIKLLVKQIGDHNTLKNWLSPGSRYRSTYKLDRHLLNYLPKGMPQQLETLLT